MKYISSFINKPFSLISSLNFRSLEKMFGFRLSPANKISKQNSVDPGFPASSSSNPFDSDNELDNKQTLKSARRTSSEPVLNTPNFKSNPFDDDDYGRGASASSSHSSSTARRIKKKNGFHDSEELENMSVQELESYAVNRAEETTKSVNNCLKIAEDIRQEATKTLETLHQQGEQINRTHMMAVDMDRDLSRPKMEDILYSKDLYEPIEGDTAKPKNMDAEKWKRLHRKIIGNIRQWLDDSAFSHVSNETDAHVLWKKLEARYEQKTSTNKAFLIRKLVNMKFKEGGPIADHLNKFQSVVNQLATMKMVIEDELQALLLLSSLPDSWETLVVTVSNSTPNGKLSMGQVSCSLFNEETRRKLAGTDNAQALVSENRGRSKNRGYKGRGKSKGRSQSRGKEQKEENNNQKKNEEKNTTGTFEGDEVVVLSCEEEECLHVGNEIEWVVDMGASYHATYNKKLFTSYKAGDFGTVKMGNTSHSKIVGIGDVCICTSVGCMMTLSDVRHVPDLRLNLISGIALDQEGYVNYFGNGIWKLTKGSLVVARGKACCALYKKNLKEEPVRDEIPLMTDGMLESDNEVEMPEEETVEQGEQISKNL
ncbi:hypothetical protein F0562_033835 [Nyssa sinensis]|uniref:Retrovirus-related Pol polyprotein from transposon TNT 1-94-like beta-barrel domain-containing protein n=1 Tax=Nyssa sinensis TaxID=561372 RepID=A0A5J5AHX3_9ASTE|nr:hypothetical protein F0562_033835 [Nyssa sinensis]